MPAVAARPRLARTRREAALAHELHYALIVELGGACAVCFDSITPLEVDHPEGVTWVVSDCSQLARVRKYWAEFKAGVPLRSLCRSCNARDGGGRRYA